MTYHEITDIDDQSWQDYIQVQMVFIIAPDDRIIRMIDLFNESEFQ